MTAVTLNIIDFNTKIFDTKSVDIPMLNIESAKSISYVIRWQLASKRSGSAKTKTMSEISGTTAKPWKQKGTGRARQGSRRSVQFVGGRACHGPMPRSFGFSMPKKIVEKAMSDVLKLKLRDNKVAIFSDFGSEIKASKINSVLSKNNIESALILHDSNLVLTKSARNLKNVKALNVRAINVYDILSFDHLLIESKIFESKILGAITQ